MSRSDQLSIYLRDHRAGSRFGIELAKRAAESNRGSSYGRELAAICAEIEEDEQALSDLMASLDVRPNPVKQGAAWMGERLGRLKLNGRLSGYSSLSRLVEIEGLVIGVSGKLELWRSLRSAVDPGNRLERVDLKLLIRRAEDQRKRLQKLHDEAAREALA
jgi:hypothetical protein